MPIAVANAGANFVAGAGTTNSLPAYNQTAGHAILVVSQDQAAGAKAISDTAGNDSNFVQLWTNDLQGGIYINAWVVYNCSGNAANVITVTGLSTFSNLEAWDITGVTTLDQNIRSVDTSFTGSITTVLTTTQAPEAIISYLGQGAATLASATQPSGFTSDGATSFGMGAHFVASAIQSAVNETWSSIVSSTANMVQYLFSFYASSHSITGSAGLAGATVAWTGTASGSTTADGSGNYTIPSLADGSYTITPSNTGYSFSSTSSPFGPTRSVTVSGADVTGQDFTSQLNPVGSAGASDPNPYVGQLQSLQKLSF